MDGRRAFGCGQCLPCRLSKRRELTARILLEASLHTDNSFLTLTYDEEHLPADRSVSKVVVQKFMKRFRRHWSNALYPGMMPRRGVRYFFVGEYGDESGRPHYHAILFGVPPSRQAQARAGRFGGTDLGSEVVAKSWRDEKGRPIGHTMLGTLEANSAQYVCGYVTKKMTRADDPRLEGRAPEFNLRSKVPALGVGKLIEIAESLRRYKVVPELGDVPGTLRFGARELPIGQFLKRRLRKELGRGENTPEGFVSQAIAEQVAEVCRVYTDIEASAPWARGDVKRTLVANALADLGDQAVRNMEGRARRQKGTRL